MAAGWTTLSIKDGGGTSRTMRVWAEDTTTGPYSFGQVLGDGSGSAALAKAEDAAAVSGDSGLVVLGVRRDTAASSSASDGDYVTLNTDSLGQLRATVGGLTLVDVTLSLDTSAYASGDLLADTQVVASAVRVNDGKGILHSVLVVDEDDQGVAFDLYFLSANNTLGTENSAPSISDANARDILCRVQVATSDYYDLGGVRVADVHGLNRVIKGATGSTSIYVAAVNGTGTPTFTASGVKLRLGILQD